MTLKQVRLTSNTRPTAFSLLLRQHLSHIRVAIAARSAGAGYLTGFSTWVSILR